MAVAKGTGHAECPDIRDAGSIFKLFNKLYALRKLNSARLNIQTLIADYSLFDLLAKSRCY